PRSQPCARTGEVEVVLGDGVLGVRRDRDLEIVVTEHLQIRMVVHPVGDVTDRVGHQQCRTEAFQLPRLGDRTTVTFPPVEVAEPLVDLGIGQCGHNASSLVVSLAPPAYPACTDDHTRATAHSHTNGDTLAGAG